MLLGLFLWFVRACCVHTHMAGLRVRMCTLSWYSFCMTKCRLLCTICIADDGIDDVEMQVVPPVADTKVAAHNSKDKFFPGAVLATGIPRTSPCNDYDPMWIVYAHPSVFPHGRGQCPAGMSLRHYFKCILQRYPAKQFARNHGFIVDSFNILQRHEVNLHSWLQLRICPSLVSAVKNLTPDDMQKVFNILSKKHTALVAAREMSSLSPAAKAVMSGMQRTGGRVEGSPQSFLSLRSRVMAVTTVFGPFTCMINLNPSESSLCWTFTMIGQPPWVYDAFGKPQGRPNHLDALRAVAANPVACAKVIHACLALFNEVFLGWPLGADRQANPNCLFGPIVALYMKYESSGRGGKHAHGQILQPPLQAANLKKLLDDSEDMQQTLFKFMESIACSYLPAPASPTVGDAVQGSPTAAAAGEAIGVGHSGCFANQQLQLYMHLVRIFDCLYPVALCRPCGCSWAPGRAQASSRRYLRCRAGLSCSFYSCCNR